MDNSSHPVDLGQLVEEHSHLRHLLEELQNTFIERQVDNDVVVAMLDEAIRHLQEHFQHEEQGGYFRGVVEAAPRFSDRVADLKCQHPQFLDCLRKVRDGIVAAPLSDESWDKYCAELQRFMAVFLEHERSENELIQEAYTRDIGTDD